MALPCKGWHADRSHNRVFQIAGAMNAAKQLSVAAHVLVWALHTGNPQLLAGGGEGKAGRDVVVEGTTGVLGDILPDRQREWDHMARQLQEVQVPGLPCAALHLRLEQV